MIKVGFGTTKLINSKNVGGADGISIYTQALMDEFLKKPTDVDIQPYYLDFIKKDPTISFEAYKFKYFKTSFLSSSFLNTPFFGSTEFCKKIDLLHATDHFIPKVLKNTPVVATLMDAIPYSNPEFIISNPSLLKSFLKSIKNSLWLNSGRWASRIITISEYSKQQISQYYKVPQNIIDVIPLGVDAKWFAQYSDAELKSIKSKYSLDKNFFVSVGTLQPRKNIDRLISAYNALPTHVKDNFDLVIIGRNGWESDDLISRIKQEKNVKWLQYLPSKDLVGIVKLSTALVFPSLNEGFGLPILEAFAAETPVLTSNLTSMPEVAESAALLFDPYDINAIANSMLEIAENKALSNKLKKLGSERVINFTWSKTAEKTIEVYKKVLMI